MKNIKKLGPRKRIALVAHDNKKADLMAWVEHNKVVLSKHELIATGTTGKIIEEKIDRPVKKLRDTKQLWDEVLKVAGLASKKIPMVNWTTLAIGP